MSPVQALGPCAGCGESHRKAWLTEMLRLKLGLGALIVLILVSCGEAATTWYVKAGANPSTTAPATSCAQGDVNTAIAYVTGNSSDTNNFIEMQGECSASWGTQSAWGTNKAIVLRGGGTPPSHPTPGATTSGGTTITLTYAGSDFLAITESTGGTSGFANVTLNISHCSGGGQAQVTPVIVVKPRGQAPLARGQLTRISNNTFN